MSWLVDFCSNLFNSFGGLLEFISSDIGELGFSILDALSVALPTVLLTFLVLHIIRG